MAMSSCTPARSGSLSLSGTEDGNQQLRYVKFFLIAINRDIADTGLVRPLTIKDLDNLEQATFSKILIYLLTSTNVYTEDQLTGKTEILLKLTEAGLPRVEYDASLDYLYWAVKKLLPENDESFTYNVLLNPKSNPKAVKQIIHFLTGFTMYVEDGAEHFDEIRVEVAEERELRNELHRELDELNAMIADKTAELDEKNEILPQLQTKLSEVNADLAKEEDALAKLEQEVEKYKKVHDGDEQEKLRLERKFEEIVELRKKLESQIVLNPEVLQKKHQAEKEFLAALFQERVEVGEKLKQATDEDKVMEDVISKSETLLTRLKECTENMGEAEWAAQEQKQTHDSFKSYVGTLNWIVTNLKHLTSSREKVKEANAEERRALQIRIQVTEKQLELLRTKHFEMRASMAQKLQAKAEKYKCLELEKQNMKLVGNGIQEDREYLLREVPAGIAAVVKNTKALIEELKLDLETGDSVQETEHTF